MCYHCGHYPCGCSGRYSGEVEVVATGTPGADGAVAFESGTWTPQLEINGLTTGITSSTKSGIWRRIEDVLFIWGYGSFANAGSIVAGNATITGLPYPVKAFGAGGSTAYVALTIIADDVQPSSDQVAARVQNGTSVIDLITLDESTGNVVAIPYSRIASVTAYQISGQYVIEP